MFVIGGVAGGSLACTFALGLFVCFNKRERRPQKTDCSSTTSMTPAATFLCTHACVFRSCCASLPVQFHMHLLVHLCICVCMQSETFISYRKQLVYAMYNLLDQHARLPAIISNEENKFMASNGIRLENPTNRLIRF